MKTAISIVTAMLLCIPTFADTYADVVATDKSETSEKVRKEKKNVTYNENGEIIKTGLNLGPLPVVAFDADLAVFDHK